MTKNGFSPLTESAIDRIIQIAQENADADLLTTIRQRYSEELKFHEETLRRAFEYRKQKGPRLGPADSDAYFGEKLTALISFADMAINPELRENYTALKLVDNVIF